MDPRSIEERSADLLAWLCYYLNNDAELAAHEKRQRHIDDLKKSVGVR